MLMLKNKKFIFLGFVIGALFLSYNFYQYSRNYTGSGDSRMTRKEKDLQLGFDLIFGAQRLYKEESGSFSDNLRLIGIPLSYLEGSNYEFGFASNNEAVRRYCPDCIATKDSFKVLAYSKFNEDSELDLVSFDNNKVKTRLSED